MCQMNCHAFSVGRAANPSLGKLLFCVIVCLASAAHTEKDIAFNNNFAEAESRGFYDAHGRWPTNLVELAAFSNAKHANSGLHPRFSPADYRSIGLTNLSDGNLQLILTSHSGEIQNRNCKRPPTTAMDVIRQEGYLIVQDGSSFYYFDKEKTFISGPLNIWQGRTIHGVYAVIAPWSFSATGTVMYVNQPCTPTQYKMKMTVNAVERESVPFDSKTLSISAGRRKGMQPFPTNPVTHQAYFVFDYMVPVETPNRCSW